ncbi:MAG: P44/Msp2 family outer membrane protein, partial [Alphaproteobacteria bacterium]
FYSSSVWYRSTSGSFYSATDFDLSVDSGFVIGAAAGYDMGNGVNFEIELAYRKQDADAKRVFSFSSSFSGSSWTYWHSSRFRYYTSPTTTVPNSATFISGSLTIPPGNYGYYTVTNPITGGTAYTTTSIASGDLRAMSIMANVWFDLGGGQGNLHPYIGGGLGMADVTLDVAPLTDSSDRAFAYQIGAGIGWQPEGADYRINLEYRYFAVDGLEFEQGQNTFEYDYNVSEILIGIRFNY